MPPLSHHHRRPTIYLQHLPRKRRHHALKRLVARFEIIIGRIVVRTRREERIIRADFQHVLAAQRGPAVQCEVVCLMVNGAPVREVGLEGGFDFPVLDQVLDEEGKAAGFVGHFLGCWYSLLALIWGGCVDAVGGVLSS